MSTYEVEELDALADAAKDAASTLVSSGVHVQLTNAGAIARVREVVSLALDDWEQANPEDD